MLWPLPEAPDLHLERLETMWAAPELLGTPTIGGGSARSGVVVEGVLEVK
jgi:hypothetical protein